MLVLNFDPFPELETDRLILRRITMEDAEDFLRLRSDAEAMKYIDKPLIESMAEIRELIKKIDDGIWQNETIGWGITLKDKSGLIGTISYHVIYREHYRAEIGYMLAPAHWNKGLITEAIAKVLDYGFNQMNLHSIEAKVNPSNNVSMKVLEKFGFVKEAYFKESYFFNAKFLDTAVYSLLKK